MTRAEQVAALSDAHVRLMLERVAVNIDEQVVVAQSWCTSRQAKMWDHGYVSASEAAQRHVDSWFDVLFEEAGKVEAEQAAVVDEVVRLVTGGAA